ncbi:MAG: hypothetical protein Q9178_000875 [Gyalolechia marmorata]
MAHHQQPAHDSTHAANACQHGVNPISEDEISAELDEPPDDFIRFARVSTLKPSTAAARQYTICSLAPQGRKASLLTQALLLSDDSTPNSDAEAPLLTSDADLTSPARTNSPSPSLHASRPNDLPTIPSHDIAGSGSQTQPNHVKLPPASETMSNPPATDLEAGLGRKRCIKFACGRQDTAPSEGSQTANIPTTNDSSTKATNPARRPCMLKFICPTRASSRSTKDRQSPTSIPHKDPIERHPSPVGQSSIPSSQSRQHRDSTSTIRNIPLTDQAKDPDVKSSPKPAVLKKLDLEGSEATRFHEFAGPYSGDDEWVYEQTAYRKKITVNDTLRKENAIRRLGEEAEEEALEEEEDAGEGEGEPYAELDEANDDLSSDDNVSDAGNETDDEEGFAESDNESELGSDYHFWTPGVTTAATSADHLEHIRPNAPRTASESSIESIIRVKDAAAAIESSKRRIRKASRTAPLKMRPGTPDLPDSTDFVCGTLDEDRPLEAAYMSCLEERRWSKRCILPQDIDPSFPTSDPEDDKDGETNNGSMPASDEPLWVMGQPDHSDEERIHTRRQPFSRRNTKSPMPSPKRLRSPPPRNRSFVHRSPPPPAAHHSTPSDSNPSMPSSPAGDKLGPLAQNPPLTPHGPRKVLELMIPHLPQRPQLTHTASLPRTPNPFWAPRGEGSQLPSAAGSPTSRSPAVCNRGPIDIVTGLEKKRQRRKEKYWRQHCRNGGKEKERRCQPGKGAERMRELGLEMAGKNKGHIPNAQLMLSI